MPSVGARVDNEFRKEDRANFHAFVDTFHDDRHLFPKDDLDEPRVDRG